MRQIDHKSSANETPDRAEHLKNFFDESYRRQVSTACSSATHFSDYRLHKVLDAWRSPATRERVEVKKALRGSIFESAHASRSFLYSTYNVRSLSRILSSACDINFILSRAHTLISLMSCYDVEQGSELSGIRLNRVPPERHRE
ncbi:hypothetical protein PUN28_015407 [Cardiocondyla obscurior]|uniref:Uncharacterized protein n=1 Tax=Cardiocondyla obscurior TaxID=286306 RepID=A0AAW2ESY1_9HYME